jgi:hypothetical protein
MPRGRGLSIIKAEIIDSGSTYSLVVSGKAADDGENINMFITEDLVTFTPFFIGFCEVANKIVLEPVITNYADYNGLFIQKRGVESKADFKYREVLEILPDAFDRQNFSHKRLTTDRVCPFADSAFIPLFGVDLPEPSSIAVAGCAQEDLGVETAKIELLYLVSGIRKGVLGSFLHGSSTSFRAGIFLWIPQPFFDRFHKGVVAVRGLRLPFQVEMDCGGDYCPLPSPFYRIIFCGHRETEIPGGAFLPCLMLMSPNVLR